MIYTRKQSKNRSIKSYFTLLTIFLLKANTTHSISMSSEILIFLDYCVYTWTLDKFNFCDLPISDLYMFFFFRIKWMRIFLLIYFVYVLYTKQFNLIWSKVLDKITIHDYIYNFVFMIEISWIFRVFTLMWRGPRRFIDYYFI